MRLLWEWGLMIMSKKEKFADWLYWKATRWVMILLLVVVAILSVKKWIIGFIIVEIIAIIYFVWMIKYEKKYKKRVDNRPKK